MKERPAAGEPAFGVSVMIPSPQIVEMIGAAGAASPPARAAEDA